MKYSKEEEEYLRKYADSSNEHERMAFVNEAMINLAKSKHSIVAKLSKMHIYIKPGNISTVTGSKPQTKEQLVRTLAEACNVPPDKLRGLETAPKTTILTIYNLLHIKY